MTSLKISETLKELRQRAGFTQQQLSQELHISRQAYSNYENGTRLPDLETACLIAEYFHISLDRLVVTGLHPQTPADPFAELPADYQELLRDYTEFSPEDQDRLKSYARYLKNADR
ncbi:MAG: helix-turn-helix transcriptional regulator [Eubacteriales bacterium]|nr:helix-turn-helix transcriptional regulator [Eubacteriales bacterium]